MTSDMTTSDTTTSDTTGTATTTVAPVVVPSPRRSAEPVTPERTARRVRPASDYWDVSEARWQHRLR